MLSFLSLNAIRRFLPALGILVVLGVIGGLWWRVDVVTEQRDKALSEVERVSTVLTEERKTHKRVVSAMEEQIRLRVQQAAALGRIKNEIANAEDSENGPVAPVVQRALDFLRTDSSVAP